MNNKKALIACVFGALSTIAGELITRVLVSFGIGKYDEYQLNSLLATIDEPSIGLGMIMNFIIGGLVGIILYLLIERTGFEFSILKSLFISLLMWFIFEAGFTTFYEGPLDVKRDLAGHYVHLVGTTTYGLTQGILFRFILYKKQIRETED